MLLYGHPFGISWYEQRFWTPTDICELGQHCDLYTHTILTDKPTERQKRLLILADSLAKQSVSIQYKFLWKFTDLHRPGSTGQCSLTALVANAIFIRLDKRDNSLRVCSTVLGTPKQ